VQLVVGQPGSQRLFHEEMGGEQVAARIAAVEVGLGQQRMHARVVRRAVVAQRVDGVVVLAQADEGLALADHVLDIVHRGAEGVGCPREPRAAATRDSRPGSE
jgi:hypothetical protein